MIYRIFFLVFNDPALSRGVEPTVIGVRLETDEERVVHVTVSYIYSLENILTCTYTIII